MITRIKITGFKSLVDVDIRLGPFTCIAGSNAVGKSNFFDALIFLSHLADKTLIEAAKSVRSDGKTFGSLRDIFHKSGGISTDVMEFEISMIIPHQAEDELGQQVQASITSVQYNLRLRFNDKDDEEPILIEKEELKPIRTTDLKRETGFPASKEWKDTAIRGRKTTEFISTDVDNDTIKIHQDVRSGAAAKRKQTKMQRTWLSNATAEYPTAFMVRHEMRSWRMLQLEPSALRKPDDFDLRRNAQLASNGAHLPATLFRLQHENPDRDIYQEVTNKLATVIEGLSYVDIDRDEKRDLLTLQAKYDSGPAFPANTLSDGTLRFLGLTVLELDHSADGVICFEEPENGIHPLKIPAIIDLLKRIAVDTAFALDEDNPFRQVIINTHSPLVVQSIPEDSLLMAATEEYFNPNAQTKGQKTVFRGLSHTWRDLSDERMVTKGDLLMYLSPIERADQPRENTSSTRMIRRVVDRPELANLQLNLFGKG